MKTKNNKTVLMIVAVLSIVVVAGLGTLFVNLGMDWFNALVKPSEWIPNIVIPIMWTIIYLIFAVVICLWIKNSKISNVDKWLLIINGILNVLWCLVFFTLNLTFIGNIVIILNLIFAFVLVYRIYKENLIYGYLTSIYPVWVSVATTLNLALWILN